MLNLGKTVIWEMENGKMDLNVKICCRSFYKVIIKPWKWGPGQIEYDWLASSFHELLAHQIWLTWVKLFKRYIVYKKVYVATSATAAKE